jgi:hypothetical protein
MEVSRNNDLLTDDKITRYAVGGDNREMAHHFIRCVPLQLPQRQEMRTSDKEIVIKSTGCFKRNYTVEYSYNI